MRYQQHVRILVLEIRPVERVLRYPQPHTVLVLAQAQGGIATVRTTVVLPVVDPHDIGKACTDLDEHFPDVAVELARLALVVRLAVERMLGALDLGGDAIDIVGAALPGCKYPAACTDAACEPGGRMRYRNGQQRLD